MQPDPAPAPPAAVVQVQQPVRWQRLPGPAAAPQPPAFVPLPGSTAPKRPIVWTRVPDAPAVAADGRARAPRWVVLQPGDVAAAAQAITAQQTAAGGPPRTAQEAEERRQQLPPPAESYPPLLRLGQLPVAAFLDDGYGQFSFQQVSPGSGAAGGGRGTGNQNYGFRADLSINSKLLLSAFYTYADDPLYAPITVRASQPENLWTAGGAALRGRLAGGNNWALAAEGSIELFTVGSGGCFSNACTSTSDNIFNTSGQRVLNRNWVGAISLPLSWNPVPRWQLALTPGVSFLPPSQAGGTFFGTNLTVGVGSSYRIGDQLNLFSSAVFPLGPGTNAFNGSLSFYRVPIVSVGANYAVNPRIALEAAVTNGFGLTPATAILALPSSPTTPMLSGRFVWNPGAPDSPRAKFSERQRSLTLGGVSVSTALLPPAETTQLWANGDSLGNLLGFAGYAVSNDFMFEASGGTYGNAGASATGAPPGSEAASFLNTYLGPGNVNIRFGGKAMVYRPTKGLPIWAAGRITVGRNFDSSSYQGYLFFESVNTWEATPWLAFNLNPKLAWSGLGVPWGVGLSANIQLGKSFQLIPELNAVATSFGGRNGTNGTLALRWLATPTTALDIYAGNASGILDLGQLLGTNQLRVGGKLTVQF
ncbi:MAG: hypothetical protein FJ060_03620 [Cyanobacteria bacterium K_Offshore_0m_m2_072]|nr:hypothetical protein [Cyanobacteria bacterium K_Offshore_0m_m2_072]